MAQIQSKHGKSWPLVLGVDIGSQSLKYILLQRKGLKMRIESFGRYSLIRSGEETTDEIYSVVNQLFKNGKKKRYVNAKMILGIEGSKVVVRRESFPQLSKKELLQTISFGIQEEMDKTGDESEEVVTDYKIVGPDPNNEENIEYVVMGISQMFAESMLKPFISEGVIPTKIIPQVVGLTNLVHLFPREELSKTIGILDIGAHKSVLVFVKNGELDFFREIVVGGEEFTKSIIGTIFHEGKAIQFTSTEAKEFKLQYGYPLGFSESMTFRGAPLSEVGAMMRPVLERLTGEIHRSIGFYRDKSGGEEVDSLYLVGGGSQLKNLSKVLKEKLDMEVRLFQLPKVIEIAGGKEKNKLFREKYLEQSMSLALALESNRQGNLLPPSYQKIEQISFFQRILYWAILGAVALMLLVSMNIYSSRSRLTNQMVFLRKRVRMAENIGQQFAAHTLRKKEIEKKIGTIQEQISTDPDLIQVYRLFSHIVPEDIHLEMIDYFQEVKEEKSTKKKQSKKNAAAEKKKSVWMVNLYAVSNQPPEDVKISIAKILVEMKKSGYFSDIEMIREKHSPVESTYRCEITGYLKK